MAKPDWGALQHQFLAEHAKTGISPKDWCAAQGLNYSSAKRYIKVTTYGANSQKKTAPEYSTLPPSVPDDFGLSEQQMIFAHHVLDGKTRVEAYRLAGYKCEGENAYFAASQIYRNIQVRRYIYAMRKARQTRYSAELDEVIAQLTAIINADPNEIAQYRRVNCRYCWGFGHQYQWRDAVEFDEAATEAEAKENPAPRDDGGYGYNQTLDPNPDCPRCNGEGRGEAVFADTRDIDGDAIHLLHGVKLGKFGIEILTADKDSARKELARLILLRSTSERQAQLDIERLELQNEKLKREIDVLKDGDKDNAIVVHNSLPIPGR